MSMKTLIFQSVPEVMSNCWELTRFLKVPTVLLPIQISQVNDYDFHSKNFIDLAKDQRQPRSLGTCHLLDRGGSVYFM